MKNYAKHRLFPALIAACAVALCLAGCNKGAGDKTAENLINGIAKRDTGLYTSLSMSSDIECDGLEYHASAAWEDAAGVRHLMPGSSQVVHDGTTEQVFTEAWSDAEGVYIYTDALGWQARGAGSNADRPVAVDFDAAVAYISNLSGSGVSKSAASSRTDSGFEVSWDESFKTSARLAGGCADGLDAETSHVTAVFGTSNQLENIRIEASGSNGTFLVEIDVPAWNDGSHGGLEVPAEIKSGTGSGDAEQDINTDQEIDIDAVLKTYEGKIDVPDGFENDVFSDISAEIQKSAGQFDDIRMAGFDGYDQFQYHNHGKIGDGLWFGVAALESGEKVPERIEAYTAYNDAWYGSRLEDGEIINAAGDLSDLACWSIEKPESGTYKLEMLFGHDGSLCSVQIEAYMAGQVRIQDLLENALDMLSDMGIVADT